jgi:hypothetical protein
LTKSNEPIETGVSPVESFEKPLFFVDPVLGHKNFNVA